MAEQTINPAIEDLYKPLGEIIASGISGEDFDTHFEGHYEWVRGYVIKMSPISLRHEQLVDYLRQLLNAYFSLKPIGRVLGDPFQQRIDSINSRRQPDLQVILKTNPGQLTATAMIGPADICIEVVSPGTAGKDYGEKFEEYEKGGVKEYWILDTERDEYRFYRLNAEGKYKSSSIDDGYYITSLLPQFKLHVPTLMDKEMPDFYTIADTVRAMLSQE
ncbi:MAG: Uma2 family endonuclease [Chitinophagaceae bacterium]|nr:Uma2 family endonuclease [Anaerolineae bacterium]